MQRRQEVLPWSQRAGVPAGQSEGAVGQDRMEAGEVVLYKKQTYNPVPSG